MLLNINGIVRIYKKEMRFLPSGSALLKMSCVSSDKYKKQDGTSAEDTCWIDVVAFGKQAEIVDKFFEEKDRIFIMGKLKQEQWEKDGQKFSKHTVKLEGFDFIEKKDNNSQGSQDQNHSNTTRREPPVVYDGGSVPDIDIDEEIPF